MGFIIDSGNSKGLFGVFEDDGDTGYLYYYEPEGAGIVDYLHIYDYPRKIGIKKKDVEVVWSKDYEKCGVKIWGKFYGIFDLASSQKISHVIKNKEPPPINDPKLLDGF
jgi:hypothetical protein